MWRRVAACKCCLRGQEVKGRCVTLQTAWIVFFVVFVSSTQTSSPSPLFKYLPLQYIYIYIYNYCGFIFELLVKL